MARNLHLKLSGHSSLHYGLVNLASQARSNDLPPDPARISQEIVFVKVEGEEKYSETIDINLEFVTVSCSLYSFPSLRTVCLIHEKLSLYRYEPELSFVALKLGRLLLVSPWIQKLELDLLQMLDQLLRDMGLTCRQLCSRD